MSKGQTTTDDDDLRVDEAPRSTLAARLRPAARRGCDRYRLTGERTVVAWVCTSGVDAQGRFESRAFIQATIRSGSVSRVAFVTVHTSAS
jgi:hypothetical protein